jgi:hypothetical protein
MMINPWLTLPFQAVRFGWETQSVLAHQMMRLAGLGTLDRKPAGDFVADTTALPPADGVALEAPTSPVEAAAPAKSGRRRQVAQNIRKIQKKRGVGSKSRRSK